MKQSVDVEQKPRKHKILFFITRRAEYTKTNNHWYIGEIKFMRDVPSSIFN